MADMTTSTMGSWTPAVWSDIPTVTYRAALVNVPLLDHRWEPEIGVGRGNIVNIPGFTQNNSASDRGAGTGTFGTGAAITFTANSEGQKQLTVNRFYYKAYRMPKEAAAQVMPKYMTLLLEGQGAACGLQVDTDVAADDTNGYDGFSTSVGTDNVDLTEDDLLTIKTDLDNQNAPLENRYAVVSPATYDTSLLKIESLRNSLYGSSIGTLAADKTAGYAGRALGFDFHISNNLETGTTGKKNAFFHKEAIAYAEQLKIQTEKDFNLEDGAFAQFLTYMTCGFLEIKDLFGVEAPGK